MHSATVTNPPQTGPASTWNGFFHLTFRLFSPHDGGLKQKQCDLTVPATATLGELLPDLCEITQTTATGKTWAASKAGLELDLDQPLLSLAIRSGDTITFHPPTPLEPPEITDLAEALAATAPNPSNIQQFLPAAGVALAVCALISGPIVFAWQHGFPPAAVTGAATFLLLLCAALVPKPLPSVLVGWALICAPVTVLLCAHKLVEHPSRLALTGIIAAAGLSVILTALLGATSKNIPQQLTTAAITTGSIFTLAACAFPLGGRAANIAGGVILLSLITNLVSATLALGFSGLRLPLLPGAGRTLADCDPQDLQPVPKAQVAHQLAFALRLPALLLAGGGCLVLSTWAHPATAATTFLLAIHLLIVVLRAPRTHLLPAALGLGLAFLALGLQLLTQGWWLLIPLGLLSFIFASTPWWLPRLQLAPPPVLQWLDRGEMFCLILLVPLLVFELGLLSWIRALSF